MEVAAVAKGNGGCIIGFSAAQRLALVNTLLNLSQSDKTLESLRAEYPTVFSGKFGRLNGVKVHFHVDKSVRPIAQKHRHIPFHLSESLERVLAKRVEQDIIELVLCQPTEWASQLVLVHRI